MHQAKEQLIDLSAIIEVLRIGRWKLFWFTVFGIVLSGYLSIVRMQPNYSATAVLALETQVQRIDGIQGVVSDMPLAGYSNELVLFTELEVFKSRFLMGEVVQKLDLQNSKNFQQETQRPSYIAYLLPNKKTTQVTEFNDEHKMNYAIDKLLKSVDIRLVPNSFAFQITANSQDPKQAQNIANSIAELYIAAQLKNKDQATSRATIWLTKQVAELKLDLEENEMRFREFDAKTALLTKEDLQVREIKLKEMRARAAAMNTQYENMLDAIMVQSDDPTVEFKSTDPIIVSTASLRSPQQFDRTKEQLAHLNQTISRAADEIYAQANDYQTLSQLRRETNASKNLYEFFLTRLKETSVQQGIQRADSRLLSRAALPLSTSSPSKFLLLFMGGVLGLIAGIIVVFLRHATRQSFQTTHELAAAFDLPVIGGIPRIPISRGQSANVLLDATQPSYAGDAMRNLRTTLLGKSNKSKQTLMICSAVSGEFKSTYARMLSQQFASLGQRVLLLDCDLRRVSFQNEFGAPDTGSLVDILQNNHPTDQIIERDEKRGFDILPSNGGNMNAADLLAGASFQQMLEKLRTQYDVILIDTPPVLLFPDARIVAQHCNQVIVTVRAEKTRKQDVQQTLDILGMAQTNITGLVLADFDPQKQFGPRLGRERFRYNQPRIRV